MRANLFELHQLAGIPDGKLAQEGVKTAVLAPIPRAKERTATEAKTGDLVRERTA